MRTLGVIIVLIGVALPAISQDRYIPIEKDQFGDRQLAVDLKFFDEPSFPELAKDRSRECYRFFWFRSFHDPVSIRIDLGADGTAVLTAKVARGFNRFPRTTGSQMQNSSRSLSVKDSRRLLGTIKRTDFWALPTHAGRAGSDGADWTIEGVKDGQYHVVTRWSPRGQVRKLGLMFALKLAKLKIPDEQIY